MEKPDTNGKGWLYSGNQYWILNTIEVSCQSFASNWICMDQNILIRIFWIIILSLRSEYFDQFLLLQQKKLRRKTNLHYKFYIKVSCMVSSENRRYHIDIEDGHVKHNGYSATNVHHEG
ncbi:unnamed protein product, partial [Cuscuta epithymum]